MTEQKRSSWDETKAASAYHFDTKRMDARWDTAVGLGRFENIWQDDIASIVDNAQPAGWYNRGYKGEGIEAPPADLAAEEYDMERAGIDPKSIITHLNWRIPASLQKISDAFALDTTMNRIHVQKPGEVWNLHIDKLQKWCPEDPSRIMRIFVQLTDWQPGQFWEYGNYHHNRWAAGDCVTFDWENIPHCTANAGYHPRVTLQITGNKTAETDKFLRTLKNTNIYKL
jgi:hypothetical protein